MAEPNPPLPPVPVIRATTSPLDAHDYSARLRFLGSPSALFHRRGGRLYGFGEAVRAYFSGADRIAQAGQWWSSVVASATTTDPLERPGTGLLSLGTFTFSSSSGASSLLTIPQTIIGLDDEGFFETTIEVLNSSTSTVNSDQQATDTQRDIGSEASRSERPPGWREGVVGQNSFVSLVQSAKDTIRDTGLHKVVVARDMVRSVDADFSVTGLAEKLIESYPDTSVFAIDGLVGASPETLASVRDHKVSLRVLAGSAGRGQNPDDDLDKSRELATSTKDLDEHRFAVRSVVDSLESVGITAVPDDMPFSLKLPNLWHLATDVVARIPGSLGVLDVVHALHPTAAVAGSPTQEALEFIANHERLDRGRYAGPVGWVDGQGNGDWAIALRCAQFDPSEGTLTAYAGAGIVAESDPDKELLETELKFRPIIEAEI